MQCYIRQYVFNTPTTIRQKRSRQKLNPFSKGKATVNKQQSKVSRLTKMAKSLSKRLQQTGQFYDRVLEFPLAMCDEHGKMRARTKSAIKEALIAVPVIKNIFKTTIPFAMTNQKTEVVIDGLKYVHIPPSPYTKTYGGFAQNLFTSLVMELGVNRGAETVTIVLDKPMFLPKIR